MAEVDVTLTVNGRPRRIRVEPRKTLADALREDLRLTGTHLGCEHGVCGACTVLVDGAAVRSCLMFAVQAEGADVTTVEGLTPADGGLSPVQQAFKDCHGLQCGFCTPGFVVSASALLARAHSPSLPEIKDALSGHLCRCGTYSRVFEAVQKASRSGGATRKG